MFGGLIGIYTLYEGVKMNNTIDEVVEKTYKELFVKYEKALDNACDMLETYDLSNNDLTRPKQTKEQWKEWALKDEQTK